MPGSGRSHRPWPLFSSPSTGIGARFRCTSAPMASVPLPLDRGGLGWGCSEGWTAPGFPPILAFPLAGEGRSSLCQCPGDKATAVPDPLPPPRALTAVAINWFYKVYCRGRRAFKTWPRTRRRGPVPHPPPLLAVRSGGYPHVTPTCGAWASGGVVCSQHLACISLAHRHPSAPTYLRLHPSEEPQVRCQGNSRPLRCTDVCQQCRMQGDEA